MTFVVTLAAFVAALLATWRKWHKTAFAALALALALAIGIGSGPLTTLLLRSIQTGYEHSGIPDTWARRNAIVLLGMGTANVADGKEEVGPLAYGRVSTAVEAYTSCRRAGAECIIIMTGGDKAKQGVTEAAVYGEQLVRLGVDPQHLILEAQSHSTWENAKFTRPLLDNLKPDKTYLVTSGVHMRRARLYFEHFGITSDPIRSDYLLPWPTLVPMAYNFAIADLAISEYRGLARFWFYNQMGWND